MTTIQSVINTVIVPILNVSLPVYGFQFKYLCLGSVGIILLVKGISRIV